MKKFILVAAIIISFVLVVYYYATSYASSPTTNVLYVEYPDSVYLTDLSGEETKIFLVSTDNPRYGFCNWSYSALGGNDVHMGDSCFIVNVTIRNDYTTDPIWTDENSPNLYNNHVKLTTLLSNHQGIVDAIDVTYPINSLHGGHVFVVEPGETRSVELYLATDSHNIERYEIHVAYIGPMMEP